MNDKTNLTDEQIKRQHRMYGNGITSADLLRAADRALSGGPVMFAASILSDAQQVLELANDGDLLDQLEQARQFINRAKCVMFERLQAIPPEPTSQLEKNLAKLPQACAARLESMFDAPMLISRGESGYIPLSADFDVEAYNRRHGIKPSQVEAMIAGSMFGWACPGADADHEMNRFADDTEEPDYDEHITKMCGFNPALEDERPVNRKRLGGDAVILDDFIES